MLLQDLRYALRQLRRAPGFALKILQPLHLAHPGRIAGFRRPACLQH